MVDGFTVEVSEHRDLFPQDSPFRFCVDLIAHSEPYGLLTVGQGNAIRDWCVAQFGLPSEQKWARAGIGAFYFIDENDVLGLKLRWHAGANPHPDRRVFHESPLTNYTK